MKILGCSSAPLLKIAMTVDRLETDGRNMVICEKREVGGFGISVPKRICKDIRAGDLLIALCVPFDDLSQTYETLVVAKRVIGPGSGSTTRVIYCAGDYWADIWVGLHE